MRGGTFDAYLQAAVASPFLLMPAAQASLSFRVIAPAPRHSDAEGEESIFQFDAAPINFCGGKACFFVDFDFRFHIR
jgi:hypothetical protein